MNAEITKAHIGVLGNSHAACFRQAFRREPGLMQGFRFTFFAAPNRQMLSMGIEGGVMKPQSDELRSAINKTSGGRTAINPRIFDGFLILGMGFSIRPTPDYYSSALMEDLFASPFNSPFGDVVTSLRSITDKPIKWMHSPLLAQSSRWLESFSGNLLSYDDILSGHQRIARNYEIDLVAQPESTRILDMMTDKKFARLKRPDDLAHMNEAFGRHWVQAASSAFSALRQNSCDLTGR